MSADQLTPEEILALQQKAAEEAAQQQTASTVTGSDVMGFIADAADIALDVLSDTASSTGDVICSIGSGVADCAGAVLGALFD